VLGRVKNNPVVAHRVLGRSGDQSRQEEPRTVSLSLKGGRSRHPGCGKPINRSNRPEHHGCVETRVAGKSICEEYTMKTTVAPIPFAGSMFGSYRHECAFFSSPQEEYATLLPFVRHGLDTPSPSSAACYTRTHSSSRRRSYCVRSCNAAASDPRHTGDDAGRHADRSVSAWHGAVSTSDGLTLGR